MDVLDKPGTPGDTDWPAKIPGPRCRRKLVSFPSPYPKIDPTSFFYEGPCESLAPNHCPRERGEVSRRDSLKRVVSQSTESNFISWKPVNRESNRLADSHA